MGVAGQPPEVSVRQRDACQDEHLTVSHLLWRHAAMNLDGTATPTQQSRLQCTGRSRDSQRLGPCQPPQPAADIYSAPHDDTEQDARPALLSTYIAKLVDTEFPPVRSLAAANPRGSEYLLFFDGGSRGNTGPGGLGSVIFRVCIADHAAELFWAASMSYGHRSTTNNTAEY